MRNYYLKIILITLLIYQCFSDICYSRNIICNKTKHLRAPLLLDAQKESRDNSIFIRKPHFHYHTPEEIQIIKKEILDMLLRHYPVISLLVPSRIKVLDLMSGYNTHTPLSLDTVGVGLNRLELVLNRKLNKYLVQDLNRNPVLPYKKYFDLVMIVSGMAYVCDIDALFSYLPHVLKNRGLLFIAEDIGYYKEAAQIKWIEMNGIERVDFIRKSLESTERFEDFQHRKYKYSYGQGVVPPPYPEDFLHIITAQVKGLYTSI